MKTRLSLVAFFMAFSVAVSAQDYQNSIGVRLGSGYYDFFSASFKTFVTQPGAIELNLGIGGTVAYTGVSLTGAYQHHFPIANVEGLQWYVGGGLMLSNTFSDWDDRRGFNVGIFPTGGADYKLKNAPFAFSADIRPTIQVVRGHRYHSGFYPHGGVTARYTF